MEMDILTLKLVLLFLMGVVPIIFGLTPLKLYAYLTKNKGRMGSRAATAISLLSCFCGGVVLGVCLLELLPEAREAMDKVRISLNWQVEYPYVELFTGVGFFIVYFVEELIGKVFGLKHSHGGDEGTSDAFQDVESTSEEFDGKRKEYVRPPTPATTTSSGISPIVSKADHRKAIVNATTFVLALIIHTSLEGFAFGIQKEMFSLSSLFFGIITHKALVAFSVGMSLAKALSHNVKIAVALILLLSSFSPIGGLVGILIESGAESPLRNAVTTVLTCFSIGTFLYIAFFEILAPERHSEDKPKLLQWLSCVLGFAAMGGFLAIGGHHHDDVSVEASMV